MTTVSEKEPIIGQKVDLRRPSIFAKSKIDIIAWCTYNPFNREENLLGWLLVNPMTKKLTWVQIMQDDIYEEIE